MDNCTVAQLVECGTVNPVVPGSSPGSAACVGSVGPAASAVMEALIRPTFCRVRMRVWNVFLIMMCTTFH